MADELLKSKQKKALFDSISRSPAQEEDSSTQEEDPSVEPIPEGPPVDKTPKIEAPKVEAPVAAEAPKEKPTPIDPHLIRNISQIFAGATPTLFGMLTSPSSAERGIAETKAFGAATKPKKLVNVIGPDGKPMLEDVAYAGGMEPYVNPGARGGAAGLIRKTYVDENNNPINLQFDAAGNATELGTLKNKNIEIASGKLKPAEETFSTIEGTDEFGRKVIKRLPKFSTNQPSGAVGSSYAAQVGIPSHKLDEAKEKTASFMNKKSSIEADARSLSAAQNLILSGDEKHQIELAAGMTQVLKSVIAEKMSNEEYGRMSTNPGLLQGLMDKIDKLQNKSPKEVQKQIKEIAYQMQLANEDYLSNLRNDYSQSFSMNDPKFKDYIERALPPVKKTVSPEQREKNLLSEARKRGLLGR